MTVQTDGQEPIRPRFRVEAIRRNTGEEHGYVIDLREKSTGIILTGIRIYWDSHEDCGGIDLPYHKLSRVEVPETIPTFVCEGPWFFEKILTAMGEFTVGVENLINVIENDGLTEKQLAGAEILSEQRKGVAI